MAVVGQAPPARALPPCPNLNRARPAWSGRPGLPGSRRRTGSGVSIVQQRTEPS